MDNAIVKKIESCKELRGKTVTDILVSERFINNFAAYWQAQKIDRVEIRKSYAAMRKVGGAAGYKLPAHPIDRLIEYNTPFMIGLYREILNGTCSLSRAERTYINQLGAQAYHLTIAQIVCAEFPELEETLIPKSKTN